MFGFDGSVRIAPPMSHKTVHPEKGYTFVASIPLVSGALPIWEFTLTA
jgi:hypothetical protein